jgi:hypothetical protein
MVFLVFLLSDDQDIYMTFINKKHGVTARAANVSVTAGMAFEAARTMSLIVASGDVASKTGITLGDNEGHWKGNCADLPHSGSGTFSVEISPASATIIESIKD